MLIYADSSVLARAYLHDELGHSDALELLNGDELLVTSTLTIIEVTSALVRADRAQRIADLEGTLVAFHADTGAGGPVTVIAGEQMTVESSARQIVREHGLRTLDALHVAAADLYARPLAGDDEELGFASRQAAQRKVATELGFTPV